MAGNPRMFRNHKPSMQFGIRQYPGGQCLKRQVLANSLATVFIMLPHPKPLPLHHARVDSNCIPLSAVKNQYFNFCRDPWPSLLFTDRNNLHALPLPLPSLLLDDVKLVYASRRTQQHNWKIFIQYLFRPTLWLTTTLNFLLLLLIDPIVQVSSHTCLKKNSSLILWPNSLYSAKFYVCWSSFSQDFKKLSRDSR